MVKPGMILFLLVCHLYFPASGEETYSITTEHYLNISTDVQGNHKEDGITSNLKGELFGSNQDGVATSNDTKIQKVVALKTPKVIEDTKLESNDSMPIVAPPTEGPSSRNKTKGTRHHSKPRKAKKKRTLLKKKKNKKNETNAVTSTMKSPTTSKPNKATPKTKSRKPRLGEGYDRLPFHRIADLYRIIQRRQWHDLQPMRRWQQTYYADYFYPLQKPYRYRHQRGVYYRPPPNYNYRYHTDGNHPQLSRNELNPYLHNYQYHTRRNRSQNEFNPYLHNYQYHTRRNHPQSFQNDFNPYYHNYQPYSRNYHSDSSHPNYRFLSERYNG